MTLTFGSACNSCHTRGVNRHGEPCAVCNGTGLQAPQKAQARRSDPETSRAAAASLSPERLRASQAYVLNALKELGPSTDDAIYDLLYDSLRYPMSPSGARTRRAELVAKGLVEAHGTERLASGRMATVWRAVR